jgi:NhaA family Na+:H+ antiporter
MITARAFRRWVAEPGNGAVAGILLLLTSLVALVWANSPGASSYDALWAIPFSIGIGEWALHKPLILWVNDALMAVFFLLVGLEIKREVLVGALSSPRKAHPNARRACVRSLDSW